MANHHHPSDQSDAGPAGLQQQQQQQLHHHLLHTTTSSSSSSRAQQALDTVDEDGDIGLMMPPADDDDDVVSLDDAALTPTRSYALPPHVTDRFYRPSTARRRGSAASSRRNSISSAHSRCSSHHSHLSGLGGPQSKYVAQHMRRASFLADRQARLADRAAHAEKVRLRAALAKSSQARDASVSAERALAAQQARERNLAEIAATCAEEVKKAKAVAETMKEKREQELASRRAQIEGRHAEAERRRREELRNRGTPKRTRALSVATRKSATSNSDTASTASSRLQSPEAAAARITWWWGTMMRKRAVAEWAALGLAVDSVRTMTFDTVTKLLVEDRVVRTAARVLRICGLEEGDAGSVAEMAAARVFLSAFLILGHPQAVFDDNKQSDRQMEQELVAKARDQLISFENILSRLTVANSYTAPPSQRKLLPEAYAGFHNTFVAWKTRSKDSIVDMMLLQFVELDAIWLTVKDSPDPDVRESYSEVKENQVQIIVRLKRLVGDKAMKMISDAVKKARRERAAKKIQGPQGDTKPRAIETSAQVEGGLPSPLLLSPDLSSTPTSSPGPATPAHASSSSAPSPTPDSDRPMVVAASLGSLLPDNRIMVHELAIDDEYVIPTDEFREHQALQQAAVIMQMRVTADQSQEETFFQVFKLLARNIKDKLQRVVLTGGRMYGLIEDLLDVDVAERQFRVGSFSYEKYFGAVASILPQLCAPARDDELRQLIEVKLQEGTLVDRAEALLGFVDTMLCDYVNHLLRQAAPGLIASSAAYETKQFGDMVDRHGEDALVAAEAAWRSARTRVMAEASRRDPEGINHPRSRPTGDKIYYEMLVDVFTQAGPVTSATVPEMLQLDFKRVARISPMIHRIVTAGAILVQCKNLLKRDVRTPWRPEANRLMTVLESNQPPELMLTGVMAALEAGRSMPAVTRGQLRALANKVLVAASSAATAGEEPREPVLRLLLGRLRGNLLARLMAGATTGSATEKVRETSSAGEKMARIGLGEFVERVREIADEMGRVARVDRAAHAGWWERVAERVAGEA